MKVAVIAANGKQGQLIDKAALGRGLDVTAIVRHENKSEAKKVIQKDILNLTAADLAPFDVVVDAFGAYAPDLLPLHTKTSQHLCDLLSGTSKRLLIVGGAGSLYMNKEHTLQLVQTPDFPAEYRPLAQAQTDELAQLRKRNDVNWTFVSPAAVFDPEGARTGKYTLAGEEFTLSPQGDSVISYADYAIGFVDEIVKGAHLKQRISLVRA